MLPLIADADIGSLKSLHALFDNLEHMLVKFEQKSYGPNYTKFWAFFDKKLLTIFGVCRHFGRRFCDWNNYLMLNC